jgi:hypothetical protein
MFSYWGLRSNDQSVGLDGEIDVEVSKEEQEESSPLEEQVKAPLEEQVRVPLFELELLGCPGPTGETGIWEAC